MSRYLPKVDQNPNDILTSQMGRLNLLNNSNPSAPFPTNNTAENQQQTQDLNLLMNTLLMMPILSNICNSTISSMPLVYPTNKNLQVEPTNDEPFVYSRVFLFDSMKNDGLDWNLCRIPTICRAMNFQRFLRRWLIQRPEASLFSFTESAQKLAKTNFWIFFAVLVQFYGRTLLKTNEPLWAKVCRTRFEFRIFIQSRKTTKSIKKRSIVVKLSHSIWINTRSDPVELTNSVLRSSYFCFSQLEFVR